MIKKKKVLNLNDENIFTAGDLTWSIKYNEIAYIGF